MITEKQVELLAIECFRELGYNYQDNERESFQENVVKEKKFSDRLEETSTKYHNRAIELTNKY